MINKPINNKSLTKQLIILLLTLIMLLETSIVSATIDFKTSINKIPWLYEGESGLIEGSIIADKGNLCDIKCEWTISNVVVDKPTTGLIDLSISPGEEKNFSINITAKNPVSKGELIYKLIIKCESIKNDYCKEEVLKKKEKIKVKYYYLGDGVCNINKGEDCTKASIEPACSCKGKRTCYNKISENRPRDAMGCVTYCGNGFAEKRFEKCNTCPQDVGKCYAATCHSDNECESGYCVHNKCSDKPFKEYDGFCDVSKGENCDNSPLDCTCKEGFECINKSCVKKKESKDNNTNESEEFLVDNELIFNNQATGMIILDPQKNKGERKLNTIIMNFEANINNIITIILGSALLLIISLFIKDYYEENRKKKQD